MYIFYFASTVIATFSNRNCLTMLTLFSVTPQYSKNKAIPTNTEISVYLIIFRSL